MTFDNLRIATKLNVFVLLIMVCVAGAGLVIASGMRSELVSARIEELKAITESAKGVAGALQEQVVAGALTAEQAKQAFGRHLAAMTYDQGQGYVFAYTMDGDVVAMPDLKLVGTNRLDAVTNGRKVIREIRDAVQNSGEAVLYYDFPRAGETAAIPKVSYATTFPAWKMFLGSGAYIDDVNAKFRVAAVAIAIGVLAMALLIGAAAWFVSRRITRPLASLQAGMRRLAAGEIEVEVVGATRRDEVGEMAQAVLVFKQNAVERRRLEAESAASRVAAEAERERAAAERAKAAEEQAEVVRRLGEGLKTLAAGDLTIALDEGFTASYAQIRQDFNAAVDKLKDTLLAVVSSAGAIETGTREISTAADDLARRTEQQAASLEETAAALTEITATVKKSAEGASHARQVVATADADAKKSAVVVREAVEAMDAIAKSSDQIGQIIGVIDEIAFQTNLLALNAGVEAARAGDAGRGFAVVASEVRALAQRSAEAAKEIKGLISTSSVQVGHGVELVAETGKALQRIMAQVGEINVVVADIAAGAHEQSSGLEQVSTAIGQMDMVTQQNASMVEQSTAASHSLSQETTQLADLVGRFQVGQAGQEDTLRRELQKAAPHAFRTPSQAGPEARKSVAVQPVRVAKKVAAGGDDATGRSSESDGGQRSPSASAMRTRRLIRPFFSTPTTLTRPISPVRATCVPPHGCRSRPTISTSRTRPVPVGGLTDIVFTRPGLAASSSSLIQRVSTAASLPTRSLSLRFDLRLVDHRVAGIEIEPAVAVADRAAGDRVGQDDAEQVQGGVGAHAAVARLPIELRDDGFADRGQRGAWRRRVQDRRAVGVVDRVDDFDLAPVGEDELAAVARLAAAARVEHSGVEGDPGRRRRRRRALRPRAGRARRGTAVGSQEGLRDDGAAVEPSRRREILLAQERRIEQLRGVARPRVGENGDDRAAGTELARQPDGAGDVDARRAAEQQSFLLDQVEDDPQRFVVGDAVGEIDRGRLEIAGDARLADPFGDRGAFALQHAARVIGVERSAERIGEGDLDPPVALLERHADAGQRAAGADRADEAVDAALGLLPDLRAGRFVMAAAVGLIVELVRPDRAVRFGFRHHFRQSAGIPHVIVGVGIGRGGHLDQLGADHPQRVLLLLRLGVGNDDDATKAERRGDHADADAGVAGGALDDQAAWTERAARHGVANDRQRGAILHRAAGVHELGLAENGAAGRRRGRPQLDQRRGADGFDDGRIERHADLVATGGHARQTARREQAAVAVTFVVSPIKRPLFAGRMLAAIESSRWLAGLAPRGQRCDSCVGDSAAATPEGQARCSSSLRRRCGCFAAPSALLIAGALVGALFGGRRAAGGLALGCLLALLAIGAAPVGALVIAPLENRFPPRPGGSGGAGRNHRPRRRDRRRNQPGPPSDDVRRRRRAPDRSGGAGAPISRRRGSFTPAAATRCWVGR